MIEDILLLGATGSIGLQTISLSKVETNFHIVGVSLKSRIEVLEEHLVDLPYLKYVAIENEEKANEFKIKHPQFEVFSGEDCNEKIVNLKKYKAVVNALVGAKGFMSSLLTLRNDMDLCLANKESLVIGGELIKKELKTSKGKLYPIDSEHVALAKLFKHCDRTELKKTIITASGGSLRDLNEEQLKHVTVKDVLNHPTWKMGSRITVDSATMVNKGFEFIEASYLFDLDIDDIEVLINDESSVHSALLFKDNSYLFEVGPSDMKVAISYALNRLRRVEANYKDIDFNKKCSLNFRHFDESRYPLFRLTLDTFKKKGTSMCFLNAVDEVCISYFVNEKISFREMIDSIEHLVKTSLINIVNPTAEDIVNVDKRARELAISYLNR